MRRFFNKWKIVHIFRTSSQIIFEKYMSNQNCKTIRWYTNVVFSRNYAVIYLWCSNKSRGTGMLRIEMILFIFVELRNWVLEKANLFKKLNVYLKAKFLIKSTHFETLNVTLKELRGAFRNSWKHLFYA